MNRGTESRKGRAHRYFAVALLTFCAVPLRAQSDLAFPHMAVGGNPAFETVLQIANDVETNNSVIIEVLQGSSAGPANGAPLPVSFDGGPLTASQTVTLAPFQEFTTVLSVADTTPQNGWVRVRSNTTGGKISGNLLFRQRSGGTVIDSVGVSSPQRFRHAIIQVDNREPGSNTGLAFVNPDSTPVTVTIALYQGTRLVSTPPFSQTLQPRQHFAKFVSEMFPSFRREQGTLVIETGAGRSVPYVTLRLDGSQLTSLPVRPLGFTFQYTVRDSDGAVVEAGFWMFDFVGFDLVGVGRRDSDPRGAFFAVSGSWIGTNFQFRYRVTFPDGTTGMAAFKGTSAGAESTVDAGGNRRAVTGTVTTVGADGQARSINNFTAFHKFGPPAS